MTTPIRYVFHFHDGREEVFETAFSEQRMDIIASDLPPAATWTALEFNKCDHCPLSKHQVSVCPPAHHLQDAVHRLGSEYSYTQVTLEVTTTERTVMTQTTMANAFASYMGLIMATSGCPYTHFFKPMARFHLPLASEKETAFRAIASFLLGQYLGQRQTLDLHGLEEIYNNMEQVNRGFTRRLQASGELLEINSLVKLDLHAKNISAYLSEVLDELKPLFDAYLTSTEI